jgi:cell division protein FtsB
MRRSILSRIIVLAVLGVIAYGVFMFVRCLNQLTYLQEQKEILAGQLGEIQEENEKLKEEISFSNTPDFIERMARTILGWVKPGEIKYVVGETPDGD